MVELQAVLQKPWRHVEKPNEFETGWRNRVKGLSETATLRGGAPVEGLPDEIYQMREQTGTENTTQM